MKIALDTNAYSALCRGDERVAGPLRSSEAVYLPMVVIGELLAGFSGGNREIENRDRLGQFLADPNIEPLAVTRQTAEHFAGIWNELKIKGRPIPTNDMWIAAHIRQVGAELITFDKHFREISGLPIRWLQPA